MDKIGNRICFYIGGGIALLIFILAGIDASLERQKENDARYAIQTMEFTAQKRDNQLKACHERNDRYSQMSSADSARTINYLQMMEDKDREIEQLREENRRLKER